MSIHFLNANKVYTIVFTWNTQTNTFIYKHTHRLTPITRQLKLIRLGESEAIPFELY